MAWLDHAIHDFTMLAGVEAEPPKVVDGTVKRCHDGRGMAVWATNRMCASRSAFAGATGEVSVADFSIPAEA